VFTVAASLGGTVSLGGSASLNGTVSPDGGSGFLARRLCGIHLAHRNNRRDPRAETALLRHRPTRTRRVVESGLSSVDWRNTVTSASRLRVRRVLGLANCTDKGE
jgi:hypothetical protein